MMTLNNNEKSFGYFCTIVQIRLFKVKIVNFLSSLMAGFCAKIDSDCFCFSKGYKKD